MSNSPFQDLIDIMNKLAAKYGFDESEIKEIQQKIMEIEAPEASNDADMNATDFVYPEDSYEAGEEDA